MTLHLLPQDGTTPLYITSQKNNVEVIKFLLASGAKVNLGRQQHFAPQLVNHVAAVVWLWRDL